MIVKYPTGLYKDVLPSAPEDRGNVTFLISNTTPPRNNLVFPKIPSGIVAKKRFNPEIPFKDRRVSYGELIFSVSRANRQEEGNICRQYELGQILEFNSQTGQAVDPMLVSQTTELRHDTNVLDYAQLGLNSEEEAAVAELSLLTQEQLTGRLNELKQLRDNNEQIINVQQKIINDTTKLINSLEITLSEGPSTGTVATEASMIEGLLVKLKQKRDVAFGERNVAIANANQYAAESLVVVDQLRTVGILVK